MGLIDDHRIRAVLQGFDVIHHEGELLECRDDDLGLLTRQCLSELLGVLVDPYHHAVGVFELVDGLLELPVEDPAIGDHHHLVEHLVVVCVVEV